jgi:hypothetical protein
MAPELRCLYYALGGGLGHGVRSLALARQMARRLGGQHLLLLNSPFAAALLPALAAELCLAARTLTPEAGRAEAAAFVQDAVGSFQPDLLIVDTFPRGLGGELAALLPDWSEGLRILVSRHLPAAYVESHALVPFTGQHYDLIIAPGEPSPFAGVLEVIATGPFLVCDFTELPSVETAAERLATTPDRPVVLVVGSGTPDECRVTAKLAAELQRSWSAALPPLRLALPPGYEMEADGPPRIAHFPLLECLRAVRLLIGGAGYNLVHEARALGVPALFQPRPRKYDDQAGRVPPECSFRSIEDLHPTLLRALGKQRPPLSAYANGAGQAAALIQSRCLATL